MAVLGAGAVIFILQFLCGIYLVLTSTPPAEAGWLMILISILASVMILSLTCPLYYRITASELIVRSGFLRWRIPLASIEAVTPSKNPLSSPALSLDRLRVDYQRRGRRTSILVSPQDKAGFLRELTASGNSLELKGEPIVKQNKETK